MGIPKDAKVEEIEVELDDEEEEAKDEKPADDADNVNLDAEEPKEEVKVDDDL